MSNSPLPLPHGGLFVIDPHLPSTPWKEYFRQKCCCTLLLCERSVYFNTCVNQLGSRTQRVTNISSSETLLLYTACFDVLKFDILTRQTVFREVGGLRYLKRCLETLPVSLPAVFRLFAISLLACFFRSSALTESLTQANLLEKSVGTLC